MQVGTRRVAVFFPTRLALDLGNQPGFVSKTGLLKETDHYTCDFNFRHATTLSALLNIDYSRVIRLQQWKIEKYIASNQPWAGGVGGSLGRWNLFQFLHI